MKLFNFRNFRNRDKWYGDFLEKVVGVVEFSKANSSIKNYGNSRMKINGNGNRKTFSNILGSSSV